MFVAAASFELAPLREVFPHLGDENFALCGIGPIAAAKSAHQLASLAAGRPVVFVGTAGVFGAFAEPYLVRASSVRWSQADERLQQAYAIPGVYPITNLGNGARWANALPTCDVLCASTISTNNLLPPPLVAERTCENLELYSCAPELISAAKNFTALFAITNAIGPDAHEQWRNNHLAAARITADFIKNHWQDPRES